MNAQNAAGFVAGMLICIGIIFLIVYTIRILFTLNLYWTQSEVAERNRDLTPGLVWLGLIPLFDMIWNLIMVPKLARSLEREFADRGWRTDDEGFGRVAGLVWAWSGVASTLVSVAQLAAQFGNMMPLAQVISLANLPIGLAGFVCFILYWVQMYQYRQRLLKGSRGYRPGGLEEDYDDRYEGPRRRDDRDLDRRDSDRYDD